MRIPVGPVAPSATIRLAIADPALAGTLERALTAALAAIEVPPASHPVVRLRSRKRLAERAAELPGAIAVVGITRNNARHLIELIDRLRTGGVVGLQLVWDGELHQRHVFAALEHARGNPAAAPVVVAATLEPTPALRLLVADRQRRTS